MNAFDIFSPDGYPIFVTRLTNVPGQDYAHSEYVRSAEDYEAFIKRNDKPGLALYHTVARLKEDATRSKEAVVSSHWVWAEVDFKDHPDIPAEDIQRRILASPNPPSVLVRSGGGLHAYHKLKEPVDAEPGPAQAELEEALKLYCAYVGGDSQAAEAARLLRMPGSTNSKRGDGIPVTIIHQSIAEYELSDLVDFWLEARPIMPAPVKKKETNGETFNLKAGSGKGPVEVCSRLAAMTFEGAGDSSINATQLSVTASELNNGIDAEQVIDEMLRATKACVENDDRCKNWNWAEEKKKIGGMVARWINKHPELAGTLPDKQYKRFMDAQALGRKPTVTYVLPHGLQVRTYGEPPPKQDAGPLGDEARAGDVPPSPDLTRKHRFRLISFKEMRPGAEQPYLIDELIPSKGLVLVWGAPKTFKSFVILDAMAHVAMGWEYRDRAVQQGKVIYCAFEGGHGYRKRIEALRRHYDIDDEEEVPLLIMPGQASLIADHNRLISDFRAQLNGAQPVAVVLDTLNKSLAGSESKDVDMSNYIRAAEAIRDAFQCVVIVVHHCGLDETRPRGHTYLPGAVDAQLSITRKDALVTLTVELMRDGPEGEEVASKVVVKSVGNDAHGRPMSSLVVVPLDNLEGAAHAVRKPWPPALKVFHGALLEALISHGVAHHIQGGPMVRAVDVNRVRAAFYETYIPGHEPGATPEQKQDTKKKAFARCLTRSQSYHLIGGRSLGNGIDLIWPATHAN